MIGSLDDALIRDVEAMGLALEETAIGADRFAFSDGDRTGLVSDPPVTVAQAARVYRCGEGLVVHFHTPNHAAHGYLLSDSPLQSDFEFSTARAGWFLLRAARAHTPSRVLATRVEDGSVVVELDDQPTLRDGSVQIAVHRRDTYEKVLDTGAKTKRGKPVTVALPQVPGGEYQAEVRVTDREG